MGTNYYLRYQCKDCGSKISLHIGKLSAGWAFAMHVHPEKDINNWDDMKKFIKDRVPKFNIVDEYGKNFKFDKFVHMIEDEEDAERTPTILPCIGHSHEHLIDYISSGSKNDFW